MCCPVTGNFEFGDRPVLRGTYRITLLVVCDLQRFKMPVDPDMVQVFGNFDHVTFFGRVGVFCDEPPFATRRVVRIADAIKVHFAQRLNGLQGISRRFRCDLSCVSVEHALFAFTASMTSAKPDTVFGDA